MRKYGEYLTIFVTGGLCYGLIEIGNRGFTHISMGLLGGISMLVIHLLNDERRNGGNIYILLGISAFFITSIEFITGELLNNIFHYNIWSYRELPFNVDGQVCLPFVFLWYLLSIAGFVLDEFFRKKVFYRNYLPVIASLMYPLRKKRIKISG